MKVDKKALIELFRPIKDFCDQYDVCHKCPLKLLKINGTDESICNVYFGYDPYEIIEFIEDSNYDE